MSTSQVTLPQANLDQLAAAWSSLDRSRPRRKKDLPTARVLVRRWAMSALEVDALLLTGLKGTYAVMRAEEPGGPQVEALRWVWEVLDAGRNMSVALRASAGSEQLFWELYWRPAGELAPAGLRLEGGDRYSEHLADQPVRSPAALTTSFLLSIAVHLSRA